VVSKVTRTLKQETHYDGWFKFTINGKSYRLKRNIVIRLQGILFIVVGIIYHKVDADAVTIFMWLLGITMLFGKIGSEC